MLQCNGFTVVDLGTDVSPQRFVEALRQHSADVLALSALLTTTMLGMETIIKAVDQAGLRERVKVIIGAAPVSQKFAQDIHADAYASTAPEGVNIIKS
jgi:5-methyltetrahydrofolate--homocysteine methyltransferase